MCKTVVVEEARNASLHRNDRLATWQRANQCCQMVYFQIKNPNLGQFWRALDWKVLIFYGHLEYFANIWEIL
jgi:hypothetical protein